MAESERKRVALVTGAGRGLGAAIAKSLARQSIHIICVSRSRNCEKIAEEIVADGGSAEALPVDVSDKNAVEQACVQLLEKHPTIDILVNNAGMFYFGAAVEKPMALSHKMTMLHSTTPADLCILFGKKMKERRCGYILNASSITAYMGFPTIAVYQATKSYLLKFSKGLHHELSHYGVKVCCVCPGAVDTDLYNLPVKLRKRLCAIGVMLKPEQIAKRGVRATLNGRKVKIPGPINYFFLFLCFLLPGFVVDLVKKKYV